MSEENNPIETQDVVEQPENQNQFNSKEEVVPVLEALLIAHGEPLSLKQLGAVLETSDDLIKEALDLLQARYQEDFSGVELALIAEQYQIRTKNLYSAYIQKLKASKPKKLSPAALETLAIIAYRQPVVKSEVEKIRGVDVSPTLKTLLDRKLIKIAGQQATPGQPSLYATTDEFLKVFGLSSLADLPNLREVEEIENSVGELLANSLEAVEDFEESLLEEPTQEQTECQE